MTILIVPGLYGSEPDHWQSRWETDLEGAERVHQESWDDPDLETWLATLADHVERRPGSVLVGHSLGATLIAHLAARHPNLDIGGALLVAPADPELRSSPASGIGSFAPLPTSPFSFPAILIASRNDPFMAQERARALAGCWDAAFVDAGEAGHINVASGHGAWPEGLIWLGEILDRRTVAPRSDTSGRLLSKAS